LNVAILNDTDEGGAHFGCQRVMETIRYEMAKRGVKDIPSIKVGVNWQKDNWAKSVIGSAKLLIVNGEGTIHHGRRKAGWLISAIDFVKRNGGSVALINCLWQDNPENWAKIVSRCDLVYCRDSISASELKNIVSKVKWIGDLSMFHPTQSVNMDRSGITVSCSVSNKVTRKLGLFAYMVGAEFVPITKSLSIGTPGVFRKSKLLKSFFDKRASRSFFEKNPSAHLLASHYDYIDHLQRKSLLVTGRFHAACFSILTKTPFIATNSNSWKIEALVSDVGLDPNRVQPLGKLSESFQGESQWQYSEQELLNIESALSSWRSDGNVLFNEISGLF